MTPPPGGGLGPAVRDDSVDSVDGVDRCLRQREAVAAGSGRFLRPPLATEWPAATKWPLRGGRSPPWGGYLTEAQTAVAGGGRARHPTSSGSELCLMGRAEQYICLASLVYLLRAVLALMTALLQVEEALTVTPPLPPPAPPTPYTRPCRA